MAGTTRSSLLRRLGDRQDRLRWHEFFEKYWRLIYAFARKCGLSSADAEDVLQNVLAEVFQALPDFAYDVSKGTFRAYLRTITQRKVIDHLRQASRWPRSSAIEHAGGNGRCPLADPAGPAAEEVWERDWRRNLVLTCLDRVRVEIEPKTYQAFQLYALEEWPVKEVADFLKMKVSSVYTAKSRVLQRLREHLLNEVSGDELRCLRP